MGPFFSVIIAAHDRRSFLEEAIKSALVQDIDPALMEIIVVANFEYYPDHKKVRFVKCEDPKTGAKIAAGVQLAAGEVIALLDDDDAWESIKLRRLYSLISGNSKIGFYHNAHVKMDEAGHVTGHRSTSPPVTVEHEGGAGYSEIRKMHASGADWNSSSLAFRKSIIGDRVDWLSRISRSPETFLFYCALLEGSTILLDSSELTRYRVHAGNTSTVPGTSSTDEARIHENFKLHMVDCLVISELRQKLAHPRAVQKALDRTILDDCIHIALTGGVESRGARFKNILRYLKFISPQFLRYDAGLLMIALVASISPATGMNLYFNRLREA